VRELMAAFEHERRTGFDFANTKRDLFLQGDCDTQVLRLLDALDWREELMEWLGGRQAAQSRYPSLRQPRLEPAVCVPLAELDPAFRGAQRTAPPSRRGPRPSAVDVAAALAHSSADY